MNSHASMLAHRERPAAWARRIASGELARGRPFYQAPLYAYFLAVLHALSGGDLLLPRLVNAALGTASVALVTAF